jgi:hypothetical protein
MIHLSLLDCVLIWIHSSNCIDINFFNIFYISSCYEFDVVILVLRVKMLKHFYSNLYQNVKSLLLVNLTVLPRQAVDKVFI